jgi:predicted RNase H-like nuclease (RuvC/YqgF family)
MAKIETLKREIQKLEEKIQVLSAQKIILQRRIDNKLEHERTISSNRTSLRGNLNEEKSKSGISSDPYR